MCGRFGVTKPPWHLAKRLDARVNREMAFDPRYNVAPTEQVVAITNDDHRSLVELRWGLVPRWAKNPASVKLSTFNARIETIATAPTYREATRARRCVIVADGFYEWRRNADGSKTPLWIHRADEASFCFAGLWDVWRSRDEQLSSCTIVTGPATEFMAPVHSRMPIVLHDDRARAWLSPEALEPRAALDILIPSEAAPEWMMRAVSARVGNVRNDDAALVAPVPDLALNSLF